MWKNETSSNFFRKTKKKLSQVVRSQGLNQKVTTSLIWGKTTEIVIYPFSRRACSFAWLDDAADERNPILPGVSTKPDWKWEHNRRNWFAE